MRFAYTKVKSKNPHYPFFLHPLLQINLCNGTKRFLTVGHLDTGADQTLINAGIAKYLGIDWRGGKESAVVGIDGVLKKIYLHDIGLEVPLVTSTPIKIQIGFIASPAVGILLGQLGFFEHFRVTFERYYNAFEVELKP